jgi:hypothetical protein
LNAARSGLPSAQAGFAALWVDTAAPDWSIGDWFRFL